MTAMSDYKKDCVCATARIRDLLANGPSRVSVEMGENASVATQGGKHGHSRFIARESGQSS